MYALTAPRLGRYPRRRGLGAVPVKGIVSTGVTAGAGAIASAVGAGAAAGPIGAAAGLVAGLLMSLNHPYGTCAPNAPDANAFLQCWKHSIPANQIPYWKGPPTQKQPGTSGWDFAYCPGASGGMITGAGCRPGCDCSTRPCVCAPPGAVMGLADGTFVNAAGQNLGPAVLIANAPIGSAPTATDQAPAQVGQALGDSSTIAGFPTWLVLGLGGLALVAAFA